MSKDQEIKAGDCILSVADENGFFWGTLWEHPKNFELRKERQDPNTLTPGDTVFIPDLRPKKVSTRTGKVHRFRKKGIPARFRLQLFDGYEYRADEEFEITIGEETVTGVTDNEGRIDVPVPAGATEGTLFVGADRDEFKLQIGHLPPVTENAGVKNRLQNLGFACGEGEDEEELDAETKMSLAEFQDQFGLEVTGEADPATQDKLVELHDKLSNLEEEFDESCLEPPDVSEDGQAPGDGEEDGDDGGDGSSGEAQSDSDGEPSE